MLACLSTADYFDSVSVVVFEHLVTGVDTVVLDFPMEHRLVEPVIQIVLFERTEGPFVVVVLQCYEFI